MLGYSYETIIKVDISLYIKWLSLAKKIHAQKVKDIKKQEAKNKKKHGRNK